MKSGGVIVILIGVVIMIIGIRGSQKNVLPQIFGNP